MRTKSLAILATTGLLAASIAYVVPAMAADTSSEMPFEQTLADNSSTGSAMQAPAGDNNAQAPSSDASAPANSGDTSNNNANSNNSNTNTDQGSPDTVNGDDDY